MIFIISFTYILYPVLIFLSRKEKASGEESKAKGILTRIAAWLYHSAPFEGLRSDKVRENLNILHPAKNTAQLLEKYYVEKIRRILLLFFAGNAVITALYVSACLHSEIQGEGYIMRGKSGSGDKTIDMTAYMTGEETVTRSPISITVTEHSCTPEELKQFVRELKQKLSAYILGDNKSLDEVREPMPYYLTEEYAEMKQEEQRQAEEEAQTLRKSIEDYQKRQEEEAQRLFEEAQNSLDVVPADEDGGADGFTPYEIPEDYRKNGGNFPESVQRHLWNECRRNGVRYAIGIALIEQESGYQPDIIGEDGDSGYTQWIPRFMLESMDELGVTDPTDPEGNITVGITHLGELIEKYDGNTAKALTAYNCGPTGAYKNYFSAGQDASPYAKSILQRAERIEKELKDGAH